MLPLTSPNNFRFLPMVSTNAISSCSLCIVGFFSLRSTKSNNFICIKPCFHWLRVLYNQRNQELYFTVKGISPAPCPLIENHWFLDIDLFLCYQLPAPTFSEGFPVIFFVYLQIALFTHNVLFLFIHLIIIIIIFIIIIIISFL